MMIREDFIDLFATVGVIGLFVGIVMSVLTTVYLNRFSGRERLIELIWGRHNEWHKGKKFDFVMASIFVGGATFAAWRMKVGLQTKSQKKLGAYAYPELDKDGNHLKLLQEFSTFARWEFARNSMLLLALLSLLIGMGFDKGWW